MPNVEIRSLHYIVLWKCQQFVRHEGWFTTLQPFNELIFWWAEKAQIVQLSLGKTTIVKKGF